MSENCLGPVDPGADSKGMLVNLILHNIVSERRRKSAIPSTAGGRGCTDGPVGIAAGKFIADFVEKSPGPINPQENTQNVFNVRISVRVSAAVLVDVILAGVNILPDLLS